MADRSLPTLPIDRLINGWLPLKTIAIPSSPMVISPKPNAIQLAPTVAQQPFIQWQWLI